MLAIDATNSISKDNFSKIDRDRNGHLDRGEFLAYTLLQYEVVSEELLMQARTSSIFTAVGPLKFPAQTETALPGPAKIYKAWQPAIHYQNTNGQSLELCLAIALSPFLPPSPVLLEALIWSISSAKGAISHPPTSYPHGPPEVTGQFGKG